MKKFLSFLLLIPVFFIYGYVQPTSAQTTPAITGSIFDDAIPNDGNQYYTEWRPAQDNIGNGTWNGGALLFTSKYRFEVRPFSTNKFIIWIFNPKTSAFENLQTAFEDADATKRFTDFKFYVRCTDGGTVHTITMSNSSTPSWTNPCNNTTYLNFRSPVMYVWKNSQNGGAEFIMSNYDISDSSGCTFDNFSNCTITTYFVKNNTTSNGYLPVSDQEKAQNYPNPPLSPIGTETGSGGDYPKYRIHYKNDTGTWLLDCTTLVRYDSANKILTCSNNRFEIWQLDLTSNKWINKTAIGKTSEGVNYSTAPANSFKLNSCDNVIFKNHDIYDINGTTLRCAVNPDGTPLDSGSYTGDESCENWDLVCHLRSVFIPSNSYLSDFNTEIKTAWNSKIQVTGSSFNFLNDLLVSETPPTNLAWSMNTGTYPINLNVNVAQYSSQLSTVRLITASLIYACILFMLYRFINNIFIHS